MSKSNGGAQWGQGEYRGGEPGVAVISGVTFGPREVIYNRVDGLAIFEGDIVLGVADELERALKKHRARTRGSHDDHDGHHPSAVGIPDVSFRWPDKTVPFQIDDALPNQQRVRDAIAHWEQYTPMKFVERTTQNAARYPNYVEFKAGSGCSSFLGMQGGAQTISLAAECTVGNAIHEIGHAIGLWHEQSREDRDSFITIQYANIMAGSEIQFDQHIVDGDDIGPYDYGSIMHYARNAYSANGLDTIVPKDPAAQIGQRNGLSVGDISAVNALYPTGGRLMIADLSGGAPPAAVRYWENWGTPSLFDGLQDDGDLALVGDFMHRGHDQLLSVNRGGTGERLMIADFSAESPPTALYRENWGGPSLFDGWQDDGDLALVGDFMHRGYDQLLSVNRGGSGGRLMIADFSKGGPPAAVRFWENWGAPSLFDGWQDDGDLALVGDFMHRGYDQLLSVNRGGSGGRLMIADFSKGGPPAAVRFWENWGAPSLFDGWQDDGDLALVGDFMHRGYDQLLSVNRGGSGGRLMIADFSKGGPPAAVRYWENWGAPSLFDGWQDDGDLALVGDFMHRGYDQLLSVNRGGSGGRLMIADFSKGGPPAAVRFWENWGAPSLFDGWQDDGDLALVGRWFKETGASLLSTNGTRLVSSARTNQDSGRHRRRVAAR